MIISNNIAAAPLPLSLRSNGQEATISQAKGFGATVAPEAIAKITADIFATFAASQAGAQGSPSGNAERQDPHAPQLRAPDLSRAQNALGEPAEKLSPSGMLAMLLGKLQQQLSDSGLASLQQRLLKHQQALQARAAAGAHLSKALEDALANAEAADAAAREAASQAESAQAAAEAAREEVARLKAELEQMAEDDPAYPAKKAQLQAAQQARAAAEARYQQAAQKLLEAGRAFDSALEAVEAQRRQADSFNAGQPLGLTPPKEEKLDARSSLQALIGLLSQITSDHSLEKLKGDSEALMAQLKAREAENLERAKKHEEEQQRARDAEKKTGCVGKIFQWVGVVVGAVASAAVIAIGVLTANPALVIGGVIGMALTIDTMAGMATGFSLMGKATEYIGTAIATALKALGVSEDLAKQIGMIMATIYIMVALIAVALATGNFASAGQHVGKMVLLAKKVVEVLQVLAQVANTAGAVTHGAGRIIVANIEIDLATLLAMIEKSLHGNQVLREMLQQLSAAVAELDRTALELLKQMGEAQANQTEVAKQVLANIRTAA